MVTSDVKHYPYSMKKNHTQVGRSYSVWLTRLSPRLAIYRVLSIARTQVAVEPSFQAGFLQASEVLWQNVDIVLETIFKIPSHS